MIQKTQARDRRKNRRGLTLLEVLISLAIFFMSIIAISSLVDMAKDKAAEAEYRSISLLVAESKMAELKSGVGGMESGSGTWETDDHYTWNLSVNSVGASLYQVNITAQRDGYPRSKVDLAQLVVDPQSLGSTMDTVPDPNAETASNAASGSTASGTTTPAASASGSTSKTGTGSTSTAGKTTGGSTSGSKTGGGSSLFGGTGGTGTGGSKTGSNTGSSVPKSSSGSKGSTGKN